jgi:hypothetical protein
MTSRHTTAFATLALVALAVLPGCNVGSRTAGLGGSANSSLLRIVNATGAALDLTSGGQVVGGEGHVNANSSSACIRIDPTTTTLGLREPGAVGDIGSFRPTLTPGASYTVVVFTSDVGTPLALTLPDDFAPTSGLAGLRIVDVAPGLGTLDVYVTPRAGPLGVPSTASIGFGGNTGFFNADPGSSQVRFTIATTPTLVFDAGTITLQPGQRYTMVLSQPGGAAATPVASLLPAC